MNYGKDGSGREIPTGSGFKEVLLMMMRQVLFSFFIIIFIVVFVPAVFLALSIIDGAALDIVGIIIAAIFIFSILLFTCAFMLLPISLSALIVWGLVKNSNNTYMNQDWIITHHKHWSMTPSIKNQIRLSNIWDVKKADKAYWKERWRETKWSWKLMRLYPLPPKGGLHPIFSTRKNLLIIFLNDPIKVASQSLGSWTWLGLKVDEHWVREVVIDIDPDHQDQFIEELRSRRRGERNGSHY